MRFVNKDFQSFEKFYISQLVQQRRYYRYLFRLIYFIKMVTGLEEKDINFQRFHPIVHPKTGLIIAYVPIKKDFIIKFLTYRIERGDSKGVIADTISCLRQFFGYLNDKDKISTDPMTTIRSPKLNKNSKTYLTVSEANRLLEASVLFSDFPERDFAMVLTLLFTGIRNSEIVRLKIPDYSKTLSSLRIIKGKPQKDRYVPIGKSVIKALDDYLNHTRRKGKNFDNLLFLREKPDRNLSSDWLRQQIKYFAKMAQINKELTVHSLRHTAGTALWESGLSIEFIRQHFGHEDVKYTQIYTHISPGKEKRLMVENQPTTILLKQIFKEI